MYIAELMESHPCFNETIAAEIMQGDFTLAQSVGGDEATISEIAAVCRLALPNVQDEPQARQKTL